MNSPNFSPRAASTSLVDGRLQPSAPPLNLSDPNTPRRICIPASRLPHSTPNVSSASIARALEFFNYAAESKSARSKQATGKLSRATRSPTVSMSGIDMLAAIPSLSSSVTFSNEGLDSDSAPHKAEYLDSVPGQPSWLARHLGRLEIEHDHVELPGFQLYAVEKWVVQRTKLLTTIVVYTGDSRDKIFVTVLKPDPELPEDEAVDEFHRAVHKLRQDGARPVETTTGVVMATYLPNFRPDLAIVHIPGGSQRDVQQALYTNIGLLRMGCTGRSALSLGEPNDSTKEKFVQTYYLPEHFVHPNGPTGNSPSRPQLHQSRPSVSSIHNIQNSLFAPSSSRISARSARTDEAPNFQTVVTNFVKLVQAALSVFGFFDVAEEERDGLLCDVTLDGIQRCVQEISGLVDVVPSERALDPAALASIISVVISTKNKINALGIVYTKDVFIEPASFIEALITLQTTQPKHGQLQQFAHHDINPFLSYSLIKRIDEAYAIKFRAPEPYKVHRVLKHKLDDSLALATNLGGTLATNISGSLRGPSQFTAIDGSTGTLPIPALSSLEMATTDLELLARMITASKESGGADFLRYVWTGKKTAGVKEMERRERGRELLEEQKERSKLRDQSAGPDGQPRAEGEESSHGFITPTILKGRMLGSSFGLGRARRPLDDRESGRSRPPSPKRDGLPELLVTHPSAGDVPSMPTTPGVEGHTHKFWGFHTDLFSPLSAPPAPGHSFELPATRAPLGDRPVSFGAFPKEWANEGRRRRLFHATEDRGSADGDYGEDSDDGFEHSSTAGEAMLFEEWVRKPRKKNVSEEPERRHSIAFETEYRDVTPMSADRLKADVDLCAAYFNLLGKKEDMERISLLLQTLLESTRGTNAVLSEKLKSLHTTSEDIESRITRENATSNGLQKQVEKLLKNGLKLDYRVAELERGVDRIDSTLASYRFRTAFTIQQAEAEGALVHQEQSPNGDATEITLEETPGIRIVATEAASEAKISQRVPSRATPFDTN